jgi:hypoxanthine phosphoribosyltransferase
MIKFDIFLSYSHPDEHIAHELEEKFTKCGLNCFSMESSLHGGDDWVDKVRDSIRVSEIILILITPRSISSKWVFMEVGAAWMENKKVIPLLQFVDDTKELPEVIRMVQCARIETEREKLDLIQTITKIKETNSPEEASLDFIYEHVVAAKSKLDGDRFTPNLFIGSGRGGAVLAGIFASRYGQPPFKVVDCQFRGIGTDRITKIDDSSLRQEDIVGKNILVVEWARQSGKTFSMIREKIEKLEPGSLQSYALYWKHGKEEGITQEHIEPPDYYGITCTNVPRSRWGIY